MPKTYQADIWCDRCGERIMLDLKAVGRKDTGDSGDWPQEADLEEAADSPQNCASGVCGGQYWVTVDGRQRLLEYGEFLENPLTEEGYKNLKKMLNGYDEGTITKPAKEWADFYGFEYWENPWKSVHDWLDEHIDNATTADQELFSIAKSLARSVDGDTIQDLFQDEMEDDGYFKETGWYSDEEGT